MPLIGLHRDALAVAEEPDGIHGPAPDEATAAHAEQRRPRDHVRPEQVPRVVDAVASTLMPRPLVAIWFYVTSILARTGNGAELILKAGLTVAAARGLEAAYVAALGRYVIDPRRPTESTQ